MNQPVQEAIARRLRPEYSGFFRADRSQFVISEFAPDEIHSDFLNRCKEYAKRRFGRIYPGLIRLLSPVHDANLVPGFIAEGRAEDFVVNLGSGRHAYPGVVNVDGMGYDNVHVVCDLQRLPFADGSVDKVISVAVLEHVPTPEQHVAEMFRVLKPGGRLLVYIPFLQPFHASPYDYQRYTDTGMRQLFRAFEQPNVIVGAGPTSALLWTLQEWLAMVLSLGSLRLYRVLVPLMWVLSPLKYLDLLLARHPAARVAASGFYLLARKPGA